MSARSFWIDCFAPFAVTRLFLLVAAHFTHLIPAAEGAPAFWATTIRWVDVWMRWDSSYYMSIAIEGYRIRGDLTSVQSNIAFFPLYPFLLRPLVFGVAALTHNYDAVLIGIVVVNHLILLGAVSLLYLLVQKDFSDIALARRSVWALLCFPTAFFLGSLYAEGLFLFLALAGFLAIAHQRWVMAGLLGCLLALTKTSGILFVIPLIIAQWPQVRWRSVSVIGLGVAAFFLQGYLLTGDPIAPLTAHQAWGKHFANPIQSFWGPVHQDFTYAMIERGMMIAFVALLPAMFQRLPRHYSAYAVLTILPILCSGTSMAWGRHLALAFPVMIMLGFASAGLMAAVQFVLFMAWAQFYRLW